MSAKMTRANGLARSAAVAFVTLLLCLTAACTPVSRGYEIHTGDLACDEANRLVHDAVLGMRMTVTGFRLAKPGAPGYLRAERTDDRGSMKGEVTIRCEAGEVHIVADQSGFGAQDNEFARGVFLGVTGRAGLEPIREGRQLTGRVKRRDDLPPVASPGSSSSSKQAGSTRPAAGRPAAEPKKVVGVQVELIPIRGFSTVLDFEADLSRAGILPIRVEIANGTKRAYEFDPRDVVLRRAGSRKRVIALTPSQAVERLLATNARIVGAGKVQAGADPGVGPVDRAAPSELGDVRRATKIIPDRKLRAKRLRGGDSISGYLYFEIGDYDRARITMIDAPTGETEIFIVDF